MVLQKNLDGHKAGQGIYRENEDQPSGLVCKNLRGRPVIARALHEQLSYRKAQDQARVDSRVHQECKEVAIISPADAV